MELAKPLSLPCGVTLPNRIMKSAMSENMADSQNRPTHQFKRLYQFWSQGRVGLCVTGNMMVDSRHLGEPYNIVLEKGVDLSPFKNWLSLERPFAMQIWAQLNHPGKQTPKFLTKTPVAPSAINLDPPLDRMFNSPRELTQNEILEIIERFGIAAELAQAAGFDGVQIHGAHGYLISQFLSPKHNKRNDEWGGTLTNRLRFLKMIFLKIRESVGATYPIGLKLNSADFQKGGMSPSEAVQVANELSHLGLDLLEISGGSYEKQVMVGKQQESTLKREAYFLEYAADIKEAIQCPLVVTGGFRSLAIMEKALKNNETDLIGLGRPLVLYPHLVRDFFDNKQVQAEISPLTTGSKALDQFFPLEIIWYTEQMQRMGKGIPPVPDRSVWNSIFHSFKDIGAGLFRRVRA